MTICRLILSGLCAFGGYSACIAFLVLTNYPAAILGFMTGVSESILTFLHLLHRKKNLQEWYSLGELNQLRRLGITILVVALCLTIYFITMEVKTKKPIMPIDTSLVLPLIWSVIVSRSAIVLIYYSVKYRKPQGDQRENLLADAENVETDDDSEFDDRSTVAAVVHEDQHSKSDVTENTDGSTVYHSVDGENDINTTQEEKSFQDNEEADTKEDY